MSFISSGLLFWQYVYFHLLVFLCFYQFFNYDFFWKKIWNGFIDKLEKYHLI